VRERQRLKNSWVVLCSMLNGGAVTYISAGIVLLAVLVDAFHTISYMYRGIRVLHSYPVEYSTACRSHA